MPLPIVCANEALCQFVETFRPLFSKPQWKYVVTILLGLVQCDERQTMTGWLRAVRAGVSLSGVSRFLAHAPWSASALGIRWMATFREEMTPLVQAAHQRQREQQPRRRGRPRRTVVTGALILDDSVHVKPRGQQMGGLGRHYATTERRVVQGHCLFQALYVLLGRQCPLPPQMYRTRATCQREAAPFASKIALAVATIQAFTPVPDTRTIILADSWYLCKAVWKASTAREFLVAGGIRKNRSLRQVAEDGTRQWQRVDAYAATLADDQWSDIIWPSDAGGQPMQAHVLRTHIRRLGACQLVCVRHRERIRFFVSSDRQAPLGDLVATLALRWEIETFFEDLKDLLGTDHYQLMRQQAILRFWTLACALYCCLETVQAAHAAAGHRSIGQIRRQFRDDHRLALLHWLTSRFAAGASPEVLHAYFAA